MSGKLVGTQSNMNINEVLSNRAIELLGVASARFRLS
jgi:fumarate hydratase class II